MLNGMMHIIVKNDWHDKSYMEERCEGVEEFLETLDAYTPDKVETITGIAPADLEKMAELYAVNSPASILYAMGITQHTTGVDNVKSVCNLAMLCGNVGVKSVPSSLLRQRSRLNHWRMCNALSSLPE